MDQIGNSCIAIADLQGFNNNKGEFILKELCFSIYNKHIEPNYNHYIFAPPFNWSDLSKKSRASAIWLKEFHHGFCWNQGEIPYNNRVNYIKPLLKDNLIIFVRGIQKIQWLKECCYNFNLKVQDINDILNENNIRLSDAAYELSHTNHCKLHRIVKHCAKQNVAIIETWLINHMNKNTSSVKNN